MVPSESDTKTGSASIPRRFYNNYRNVHAFAPGTRAFNSCRSRWAPRKLTPDIPRIQAACHGGVGGAFDNGAAVREKSHFVGVVPEFQNEVVVADGAVGLKAAIHFGEVNGALALMDLHGIPTAEGDMRTAFTGEMD